MRSAILVLIALVSAGAGPSTRSWQPESEGDAGRHAFNDLSTYYQSGGGPLHDEISKATSQLSAQAAADRSNAGQYLLALARQTLADEGNGRAKWKAMPWFGGGSENSARELRKDLAQQLSNAAGGEETIELALWLINEDPVAEDKSNGIKALRQIHSPEMTEVFRRLLSPPHHDLDVAVGVVEEVATRRLTQLSPEVAVHLLQLSPATP